jgi:acyl-CoA reductase-like NAD-dependent aldehyde dehydrogenase
MTILPFHAAGRVMTSQATLDVFDKFTGEVIAKVAAPGRAEVDLAIAAACAARDPLRRWAAFRRRAVLECVVREIEAQRRRFESTLVAETGKPIRYARAEVDRCIDTFRIAVEESTRRVGEWMPLDSSPRNEGLSGLIRRVPIGVCSFIAPFNFPLNLAAHKIAPAIAAGCPFVLKPDPRTPLTALLLGEILAATDLPAGSFSVLPVVEDGLEMFSEDDRIALLSFTGSPAVGWMLKSRAGRKRVTLELGGNAACIVERDADLDHAADRITFGAFYQSGQSCISVQRIIAHRSVHDALRDRVTDRVGRLREGDPRREETDIGPMISEKEAARVERWVAAAVQEGAVIHTGGERRGAFHAPTLLLNVNRASDVYRREVFGPVAMLEPFDTFDEACRLVNDSEYGLQAGVFTRDLHRAFRAFEELEVGAVVINDVPSVRADAMPYGGVKQSGLGREGVRFAMDDMTEPRAMLMSRLGAATD